MREKRDESCGAGSFSDRVSLGVGEAKCLLLKGCGVARLTAIFYREQSATGLGAFYV
jgi:hypothetical protein